MTLPTRRAAPSHGSLWRRLVGHRRNLAQPRLRYQSTREVRIPSQKARHKRGGRDDLRTPNPTSTRWSRSRGSGRARSPPAGCVVRP
jgi:hypothetical protein